MNKNKNVFILRNLRTALFLGAFLPSHLLAAENTVAPLQYSDFFWGYSGGWGAPYGLGLQTGYLINNQFDINVGTGFGLSGAKIGVGSRLYLNPERKVTPFFGLNYVLSSSSNLTVADEDQITEYRLTSNTVLHLRAGVKATFTNWEVFGVFGYGYARNKPGYEHVAGNATDFSEKFARNLAAGGYEASMVFLTRY